ncbi:3-hydroxyacyl-ACP dehydratase FabZ family protein [Amycolatopsis anabasis]|uniref:3-hydroxyacyl-ACP dehydratase FabZ family protein n=1 Tax=Amycolatopsis anabasis TaxID=1840409 RepID=UPI00131ABE6A|nr:3-hydroxyacyl-ACP dehydratase FabZ family protein [Amycolatopsis anabasis]
MTVLPDPGLVLPHRYPMLLVDRVTEFEPGTRIRALKAVTRNEPCYARAAAGDALGYPETLLLESWAQTAGLLVAAEPGKLAGQIMLLGSMSEVTFRRGVFPGDVVEHRARIVRALSTTVLFAGECAVGPDVVCTVSRAVLALRAGDQLGGGS